MDLAVERGHVVLAIIAILGLRGLPHAAGRFRRLPGSSRLSLFLAKTRPVTSDGFAKLDDVTLHRDSNPRAACLREPRSAN